MARLRVGRRRPSRDLPHAITLGIEVYELVSEAIEAVDAMIKRAGLD